MYRSGRQGGRQRRSIGLSDRWLRAPIIGCDRLPVQGSKEIFSWRLAVPAVVVAAAIAGCITYFVAPALQQQVEADQRLLPTAPSVPGRADSGISANIQRPATEDQITAYQRAADAILRRAQNATASAGPDEPPVTGLIPLPRRRPIPRP
jgi:hypothetical protein